MRTNRDPEKFRQKQTKTIHLNYVKSSRHLINLKEILKVDIETSLSTNQCQLALNENKHRSWEIQAKANKKDTFEYRI